MHCDNGDNNNDDEGLPTTCSSQQFDVDGSSSWQFDIGGSSSHVSTPYPSY